MFSDNISPYIDDELTGDIREEFLRHASVCKSCNDTLKRCVTLKKTMGNLPKINVSSGFDYGLQRMIRIENMRLKNPAYRFRLFLRENWKTFVVAPATAVIILGLVFLYPELHNNGLQSEYTSNAPISEEMLQISEIDDIDAEIVRYVLEKVEKQDAVNGVFLNEPNLLQLQQASSTEPNVKIISF